MSSEERQHQKYRSKISHGIVITLVVSLLAIFNSNNAIKKLKLASLGDISVLVHNGEVAINKQSFTSTFTSINGTVLGPMFYNFYITPDYPDQAVAIALEQMKERKMTGPNETILYTLIGGDPNSHTPELSSIIETIKSNEWCRNDNDQSQLQNHTRNGSCRMREYLHKGDEVDTLQALWQYCVAHPHEIVSYFHDKGSFHSTSENVKARRLGTKSTFHCHSDSILKNNLHECNVCTARFSTQPQYAGAAK